MNRRALFIVCTPLVFAVILTGCGKSSGKDDRIIATIGSRPVMMSEFDTKIAKLPAYYQNIARQNRERFLDEMIMESLLYEEAVRKSMDRDSEVREVLADARKKILVAKLIKSEVDDRVDISASEAKLFYEQHKEQFRSPQLWRASHILVADEAQAMALLGQLAGGASFEELARANSTDATATRGGDIGYFRMGQLVPDFEKACVKLGVGETSDVVKTQFGYHIIKLTDKKEEGSEPFEKVAGNIEDILKRKKRGDLFDQMVAGLKKRYDVNVKEDAFSGQPGAEPAVEPEGEKGKI